MDRLKNSPEQPWFTVGDMLVVMATLIFLVLGIIRHVRAEDPATPRTDETLRRCR